MTGAATDAVLTKAAALMPEAVAAWSDFLRIPSISAQPDHAGDCRQAAAWARDALAKLGFAAALHETEGHPVVLATHPGPDPGPDLDLGAAAPHLLYYGHYDVQPPEPLELWPSPPFTPTLVDGPRGQRMVARGAVDDKGQVAAWLGAFAAWFAATGTLPVRLTVLLEGEEEIGSPHLEPFLTGARAQLAADAAVISDTNLWDFTTPAITTGLRGLLYVEIRARAASRDLHSGLFGGVACNPINELVRALGALRDAAGLVQIPGFYDGVAEPDAAQKTAWAALGFDAAAFLGDVGLTTPSGETGRGVLERLWARPTADLNGIWGGYAGPGAKTVIPAEAGAKISFRLVPGQNPEAILAGLKRFLAARVHPDLKLDYALFGAAPGIAVATDLPVVAAARAALAEEYSRLPVLIGCGASIPVVESLKRVLGLETLLMGFGLDDDQIHSPGEKFEIACFEHGLRAHIRLLGHLAARSG